MRRWFRKTEHECELHIMSETDKRAIALWTNAARSLKNYQQYIDRKRTKYELTLIDLLYISNFKGGNASIHEEEGIVNTRSCRCISITKPSI